MDREGILSLRARYIEGLRSFVGVKETSTPSDFMISDNPPTFRQAFMFQSGVIFRLEEEILSNSKKEME